MIHPVQVKLPSLHFLHRKKDLLLSEEQLQFRLLSYIMPPMPPPIQAAIGSSENLDGSGLVVKHRRNTGRILHGASGHFRRIGDAVATRSSNVSNIESGVAFSGKNFFKDDRTFKAGILHDLTQGFQGLCG